MKVTPLEELIERFADRWGPHPAGEYRKFLDDLRELLDCAGLADADQSEDPEGSR